MEWHTHFDLSDMKKGFYNNTLQNCTSSSPSEQQGATSSALVGATNQGKHSNSLGRQAMTGDTWSCFTETRYPKKCRKRSLFSSEDSKCEKEALYNSFSPLLQS